MLAAPLSWSLHPRRGQPEPLRPLSVDAGRTEKTVPRPGLRERTAARHSHVRTSSGRSPRDTAHKNFARWLTDAAEPLGAFCGQACRCKRHFRLPARRYGFKTNANFSLEPVNKTMQAERRDCWNAGIKSLRISGNKILYVISVSSNHNVSRCDILLHQ
jgi:hypothetical protein